MDNSAFSSAFFTLVGTHGFHVAIGFVWITLLLFRNAKRGFNLYNAPKYYTASLILALHRCCLGIHLYSSILDGSGRLICHMTLTYIRNHKLNLSILRR